MGQYGSFDNTTIENDKIIIRDGGGVTSCLSVRLDNVIAFKNKFGVYPTYIDSTQQFLLYSDSTPQDVAMYLLRPYVADQELPASSFYHDLQFSWYSDIGLPEISKIAEVVCPLSDGVLAKSIEMKEIMGDRIAILYRGNDKGKEIKRTPFEAMINLANESGGDKFLVQTDEEDFYRYFKERFPNTICFDELPRISKDPDSYVMPPKGQRVEFAMNFLAALKAMASAKTVILNTGNTAMFLVLFRGNTDNVYQFNSKYDTWKKL